MSMVIPPMTRIGGGPFEQGVTQIVPRENPPCMNLTQNAQKNIK
jgi:hypothetical protein